MKGFDTEEQFERFVQTDPHSENVLAAVVFEHPFTHDDEPLPLKVTAAAEMSRKKLCHPIQLLVLLTPDPDPRNLLFVICPNDAESQPGERRLDKFFWKRRHGCDKPVERAQSHCLAFVSSHCVYFVHQNDIFFGFLSTFNCST